MLLSSSKGYDGIVIFFYGQESTKVEDASPRIRLTREGADSSSSELPSMTVLSSVIPVQPGEIIETEVSRVLLRSRLWLKVNL